MTTSGLAVLSLPCDNEGPMHRGALCQFPFRWIYCCGINESTGKDTGKMHLCAMVYCWWEDTTHLGTGRERVEKWAYFTPTSCAQNNNSSRKFKMLKIGSFPLKIFNLVFLVAFKNLELEPEQKRSTQRSAVYIQLLKVYNSFFCSKARQGK